MPTDFEAVIDKSHYSVLLDLLEKTQAKLDILHISSPEGLSPAQKENRSALEDLFGEVMHEFHDWPDQDLIPAIEKFIGENDSDMLVMVRNKHTFVERLFIEPVLNKIAFHTDKPLLVLPSNP